MIVKMRIYVTITYIVFRYCTISWWISTGGSQIGCRDVFWNAREKCLARFSLHVYTKYRSAIINTFNNVFFLWFSFMLHIIFCFRYLLLKSVWNIKKNREKSQIRLLQYNVWCEEKKWKSQNIFEKYWPLLE